MRVYMIFWSGAFEEWRLMKVFSNRKKADDYLKGKSDAYWLMESNVE